MTTTLLASVLLGLQPRLKRWIPPPEPGTPDRLPVLLPAIFFAAVYGGYFGGALGAILIATLSLCAGDELKRLNATKGVLSLVDHEPEMGGFQGVPELFRTLGEWRKTQPADRDPWKPDTTGFEVVPVMPKAGDLLIFNSQLEHGIRPNV